MLWYFIPSYGTTTQTQTTTQAQQIVQQTTSRMSPSSHSQYQNPINPCVSQVINAYYYLYNKKVLIIHCII